jgi:hypothetical protein
MPHRSRTFLATLTRSPWGLFGTIIAGTSAFLIITLLAYEAVGETGHPYLGIITYILLPAFLLIGLVLIAIGIRRQTKKRRAREASGELLPEFPVIDLNDDRTRTWLLTAGGLGAVAAVLLATTTMKGVEYVDSNQFCGTTCHVMEPEWTAYQRSPHARVHCVDCHIGSGAASFVQAKLSGARQVVALLRNSYNRPIPTPVHDLRPARATCNECHWPTRFHGDRTRVITRFRSDSANTETQTIIVNNVGGGQEQGVSVGVHWHVDPSLEVHYTSDESREFVKEIETIYADGTKKIFRREPGEDDPPAESTRTMDCIDCHNRPTHVYLQPEEAVNEVLRVGILNRDLPYIRREGLQAITAAYGSHEEAREGISRHVRKFYADSFPSVAEDQAHTIDEAVGTLQELYVTNVFPQMNIAWGTYTDHLGHSGMTGGCFRCHNLAFTADDGSKISADCELCHQILAYERTADQIELVVSE